ncbi:sigma-54 dependent transcriptional regulator [Neiella marina]|uniref:Sigma-54 dependent transcriptional regulator n=1 Tax=Neiella holothuriorum TaxID=2870530 RepID=A0ABS7EDV1_9GAMM|nr:sigma-54 dependent transcriptional regulator [Neiella holothuriorum]MBW8190498.1 sigma-54 dependent transcriptional regulator [Neiella holothuriorum]
MGRVLVVDDNPDILDALELLLSLHEHEVITASSMQQAITCMERRKIDLVIQDMNFTNGLTSGNEGRELFYKLKQLNPTVPIIVITAWTHLHNAVELVKAGATDYLPKPWDDSRLLELVSEHINNQAQQNQSAAPVTGLTSNNPAMKQLLAQAAKVAQANVNVLITGPNGAGKEVIADAVQAQSERSSAPWIKVNMGALPGELMEAELFGAKAGAFTGANSTRQGRFEAADGGTLFLDEIGNLSLSGQMKLLRVLQSGEYERLGSSQTRTVDVRVIAATNADLPAAIRTGTFREDLYYRLNVVSLQVPALSQRKEDIVPLAQLFIGEHELTDSAKQWLISQPWPGNVRELQNCCQRAVVFSSSGQLKADDFGQQQQIEVQSEQQQIESALTEHNWVIKKAAESLGLTRQALYRRIEKYQLSQHD